MDFLHKETTGSILVLNQEGEKSSYVAGDDISGHLKPYSLEDQTFEVSGDAGALFKLTLKDTNAIPVILETYKIIISGITYVVRDVKDYSGISFHTKKILLAREK